MANKTRVLILGGGFGGLYAALEFEKRNDSFLHELGSDGSANQERKLGRTDGEVLVDLHDAEFVLAAFGLNGKNVVCSFLVHSNVKLVGFNLAHVRNGGAKVALK